MRLRLAVAALALAWGPPAPAQDALSMGQVQSPILILDVDRLLAETQFGRRLAADIQAQGEALAQENRRIEGELTAEERSLTERRPTMDPEAFREEADAFDVRVQRIRDERDAKQRALEAAVAAGRDQFLQAATPVFWQLMLDSGAVAILDRREVFLSANAIDVTDEAIQAIDAAIGPGPSGPAPAPRTEEPPAAASGD
jgi:Skp family chaperone for outer membrane proteins